MKTSNVLLIGFMVFAGITFCVFGSMISNSICYESDIPDPVDINIEAVEPNEIILWPEEYFLEIALKDEPTFEDGDRLYLYKGDDFDIVIEKKKPEPNEPMKYSLPIPTWPDYIELDKDLLIIRPVFVENWKPISYTLEKGTIIYFKDD